MKNRILSLLLSTLLLVPVALPSMAKVGGPIAKTAAAATPAPGKSTKPKKSDRVDINSASASDLDAIKGIGPKTAAKIIAGRPYAGKDDLLTRKIVNKGQYAMIKDYIVARQGKKGKK